MPETQQSEPRESRREFRIFMPKTQLAEVKRQVEELKSEREQRGRLRNREQRRLERLEGITRREFIKKVTAAAAGVTVASTGIWKGVEFIKEQEKKEPIDWLKAIIKEYNHWFEDLTDEKVEKVDAVGKFIEVYNDWRRRISASVSLPELSKEDTEDLNKLFTKLDLLIRLFKERGYFLMIAPTFGEWRGKRVNYMAVVSGKIMREEERTVSRRRKAASYTYVSIDTPDPKEDFHSYASAPVNFSASPFETQDGVTILQAIGAYRKSAQNTYNGLMKRTEVFTERDAMRELIFAKYRSMTKEDALSEMQKRYTATSLEHEEQHVLDGILTGSEGIQVSEITKEKLSWWIVGEVRGLVAPIGLTDPKIALYSISNWRDGTDQLRQTVGSLAVSILRDVSGYSLVQLLEFSDDELRKIGEQTIGATDILYDLVVTQGKQFDDPQVQQQFDSYIDSLRGR